MVKQIKKYIKKGRKGIIIFQKLNMHTYFNYFFKASMRIDFHNYASDFLNIIKENNPTKVTSFTFRWIMLLN
jgi:hypothetical protein